MLNWLFWTTGAAVWTFFGYRIAYAAARCVIFAHRMGWKNAKAFGSGTWLDWFLSPPDCVEEWYWPSRSGAAMRARHEAED